MTTKAIDFLSKDIEQDKLFNKIEKDILTIIDGYELEKTNTVKHTRVGEITVKLQDKFSSTLIKDINHYMGIIGEVDHGDFDVTLRYKVNKKQADEVVLCDLPGWDEK